MAMRIRLLSLLGASALACLAQSDWVAGPVTGWVYDPPSQSVRLIAGMPGAARLGPAVAEGVSWASVAPNGGAAVLQLEDEVRFLTASDVAGGLAGTPIGGAVERPQSAVWAADSSAVALYSPTAASVQWVRISRGVATADAPIPLAGIDGAVACIAADSTSRRVFLAAAGQGLYRISPSDGPILLAALQDVSAIAVEPGGWRTWIADRANGNLVEVTERRSEPVVRTLLSDAERLSDVAAIFISQDRQTLYLADRGTSRLYSFERKSASLAGEIDLPVPATSMTPLGRPSLLLVGLRSQSADPLYLLKLDAGAPAFFFVPSGDAK